MTDLPITQLHSVIHHCFRLFSSICTLLCTSFQLNLIILPDVLKEELLSTQFGWLYLTVSILVADILHTNTEFITPIECFGRTKAMLNKITHFPFYFYFCTNLVLLLRCPVLIPEIYWEYCYKVVSWGFFSWLNRSSMFRFPMWSHLSSFILPISTNLQSFIIIQDVVIQDLELTSENHSAPCINSIAL